MFRSAFLFEIVLPAVIVCWAATLLYSAVASDTGYRALAMLESEVAAKTGEVDALREHRLALEKRADLLNSGSLDPDLADERIRAILGYSRDGDIVIPRREVDRLLERASKKRD